jgi:hypothetical protein
MCLHPEQVLWLQAPPPYSNGVGTLTLQWVALGMFQE